MKIANNKFKTKSGRLTPYALACGYLEEKEKAGIRVQLWHDGGPYYQVKAFDHSKGKRIFWDSFERLTDARRRFSSFSFTTHNKKNT